jgi:hypothetical protein
MNWVARSRVAGALSLLAASIAWGQLNRGTITGLVTDPSGAGATLGIDVTLEIGSVAPAKAAKTRRF